MSATIASEEPSATIAAPCANRVLQRLRTRGEHPPVIAHRGDSVRAPENTLASAWRAWRAGADVWEFDVQLSRDGVPVVIHDESLLRTTDVARRFPDDPRAAGLYLVSQFDFDEIRALDAGLWFLGDGGRPGTIAAFGSRDRIDSEDLDEYASGAVRVPSLREALEFVVGRDWLANIELKSFPNRQPGLLDATLAEVEAAGAADRVVISSFDHRDVARVRPASRRVASGALTASPLAAPDRYLAELVGADCFHPSAAVLGAEADHYRERPSPEALATADLACIRARGIPVLVFTVNDTRPDGLAEHLAQAGADALFTDDPEGMRALFRPAIARRDAEPA